MRLTQDELLTLAAENPALAAAIQARLAEQATLTSEPSYITALFGPQRRFVLDRAKRKAALCSRRAGKTEAVAAWLIEGGMTDPKGLSLYVALSRNSCRKTLWRTMEDIDKRHGLGLDFIEKDNQLHVGLPNGHMIWLAGCKDSAEIDKFRGLKLRRAVIDEAASYGSYLKPMIEDVIEHALMDLDGDLALIGTPGVTPSGYFWEVTGDPHTKHRWSIHHWCALNNPHIQINRRTPEEAQAEIEAAESHSYVNDKAREWLNELLLKKGWTEDHPTFRREALGQWVLDTGALVYPIAPLNLAERMPANDNDEWIYHLGIDVGYEDDTAFVVAAYRRGIPGIWVVHAEKEKKLIPSAVAVRIERLKQQYPIRRIVMDTGGLGKGYETECSERFGLYIERAEKTKKRAYQEIVRGELAVGNVRILRGRCPMLLDELGRLVWNEDGTAEDDRFPNHLADAFLYVVRSILNFYRPEFEERVLSEPERLNKEAHEYRQKVIQLQAKAARRTMASAVRSRLRSR